MNKQDAVAVIMGGPSSEAEISKVTGAAIADALTEKGYQVTRIELEPAKLGQQLARAALKLFSMPCTHVW